MRRGFWVVLILVLVAVVLGTLAQYAGNPTTPGAPPAHPPVTPSTGWFGPSLQTWMNTASQPFYLVIAIITAAVILVVIRQRRVAGILLALGVAGLFVYWFHPDPVCAERDLACIAAQQRVADAKAAEELRKEQQQQEAIALAAARTPSGFMPAIGRMVVEYRQECVRTVIDSYTFQAEYAPFPGGRCSTSFMYPSGTCVMYKASEHGPEDGPYGDCRGSKSPAIPADPMFARSIGAAFSVKLTVDQPVTTQVFR